VQALESVVSNGRNEGSPVGEVAVRRHGTHSRGARERAHGQRLGASFPQEGDGGIDEGAAKISVVVALLVSALGHETQFMLTPYT
jgi:hypothetical protein